MTAHAILLLPEAQEETEAAFLWYFERSPLAADAFRAEVIDAIDQLAVTADIWPMGEGGARRYVLKRFPYTLHYDFDGHTVTVLAVAHQRRRPNYWRKR